MASSAFVGLVYVWGACGASQGILSVRTGADSELQQVQAVELGGELFAGQGHEVGNFSL